ncbi:uncharacterized protein MYCFIDRAFT_209434 [Pseudocercospora fijiensis CIRAD86]|uniref:Uncharacterized protein n=1 Tax=Pseudocercospora fijiensis (strain CIRAD86) TaxID=383855 RepID=N1Q8H2_PSEFD|nr:uncharacterized protein MYCFIDRAFT_209434 [Pseudocercospora fijiensis CIRAD86]EME87158.1 hypothetical protein MYCFIDRAFT_209434 [Pseudocercospora fijiensis CIRAD86]
MHSRRATRRHAQDLKQPGAGLRGAMGKCSAGRVTVIASLRLTGITTAHLSGRSFVVNEMLQRQMQGTSAACTQAELLRDVPGCWTLDTSVCRDHSRTNATTARQKLQVARHTTQDGRAFASSGVT